jgi:hypothetical protein
VVVTGSVAPPAESDHVLVTVNADTTPPALRFAVCGPGANQMTLYLTEQINTNGNALDGLVDLYNWKIRTLDNAEDLNITADLAYAVNGSDVTLTFNHDPRNPNKGYKIVFDADNQGVQVADTAHTPNYLATFASTPVSCFTNQLAAFNSVWRYNASGADLGTGWKDTAYDDSGAGWASGAGVLAVETAMVEPINTVFTPYVQATITYYFRRHVAYGGTAGNGVLVLRTLFDDGGIVYLNGVEVFRLRMPAGTPGYLTPSAGGPLCSPG